MSEPMADILWRRTTYSGTDIPRFLYKPVSPAGEARLADCLRDGAGWYGFGNWGPDHAVLHFARDGLTVAEAGSDEP